ncbi:peptidyl-prolyl cis-trans isomerase FKBP62-like [Tropilaelaps mercedesae]|uniref:Peptidyl-prolyl cis-trans isomerase FKBP62-like n=1 Tax=Tropilaelaps mercedesae TaxID=418985 RepID=A0A1V9XTE4_9ACAR|nr:peptidyl-prolyl cis-trans isomerase FKBP62-like [Tropilaelaps mercedesae]
MKQVFRREILKPGVEYTVPPDGAICHLQVLDDPHGFFSEKKMFEMNTEEKWRLANWHKDCGVSLFTGGKLEWAFRQFSLALKYIISLAHSIPKQQHDSQEMNINQFRIILYLNMSVCQLKVKNYQHAYENASKALTISPKNSKGLYRRGTALMHLQEYEKSLVDLKAARELEPGNVQIEDAFRELRVRMRALDKKYATAMKKMFS